MCGKWKDGRPDEREEVKSEWHLFIISFFGGVVCVCGGGVKRPVTLQPWLAWFTLLIYSGWWHFMGVLGHIWQPQEEKRGGGLRWRDGISSTLTNMKGAVSTSKDFPWLCVFSGKHPPVKHSRAKGVVSGVNCTWTVVTRTHRHGSVRQIDSLPTTHTHTHLQTTTKKAEYPNGVLIT